MDNILDRSKIFKSLPEPLQKVYREIYGVAETGTSIITGAGAVPLGIAKNTYDKVTHQDNGEIAKLDTWMEENKDFSDDPRFLKVQKERQRLSELNPNTEKALDESVDSFTYSPRTEEGQRNVQAIGETMEEYKIPPYVPGVGPAGRFGIKRKPRAKKVKPGDPESVETADALFTRAKTYFDEADEARVDFQPNAIKNLVTQMRQSLKENNISDLSSYGQNAYTQLNRLEMKLNSGQPVSFNKIMEFRDLIDDVETVNKPKSRMVSSILRDDLDTFIADAGESVIAQSSQGTKANLKAFKQGQQYYSKAKNTQILEEAVQNAQMTKSGNYSQAQLVDAMKKEVKKIVKNKKKFKFFKAPQKEVLRDFAKGGNFEEFLKQASKLDPISGGFMLSPTALATLTTSMSYGAGNGAMVFGTMAAAGQGAKAARSALLKNSIDKMMANVQNRQVDVNTGFSQVDLPTELGLLGSNVAGQSGPDEEIQSLLEQQKLPFPQGR
jgi:hypothetical protein